MDLLAALTMHLIKLSIKGIWFLDPLTVKNLATWWSAWYLSHLRSFSPVTPNNSIAPPFSPPRSETIMSTVKLAPSKLGQMDLALATKFWRFANISDLSLAPINAPSLDPAHIITEACCSPVKKAGTDILPKVSMSNTLST